MKKFILTNITTSINTNTGKDVVLHRIKAIKSFGSVKKGELGGWVEYEDNLSHKGNCWIYDDAKVYGSNTRVYQNASITDYASVFGGAEVGYNAYVGDTAEVCNGATVQGNAKVYDNAAVSCYSKINGYARISGNSFVTQYAVVSGNSRIRDKAFIRGRFTHITGNVDIRAEAEIRSNSDYLTIDRFPVLNETITFFRVKGGDIYVHNSWYLGPINKFNKHIPKTLDYKTRCIYKKFNKLVHRHMKIK